jgi:hypothetical protein
MPISISGSGTITGISAGGLPDASIVAADIADANITAAKLDGAQTGSAPIYGCRAWVNFDGTRNAADTGASTNGANVKIRASGNVTSVLKNSVGNYTVNFTTALPDANYVPVALCGLAPGSGPTYATGQSQTTDLVLTASSFRFGTGAAHASGTAMTNLDPAMVSVAFFR